MKNLPVLLLAIFWCAWGQQQPGRKQPPKQFVPPPAQAAEPVLITPPAIPDPPAPDVRKMGDRVRELDDSLLGRRRLGEFESRPAGSVIRSIFGFVVFLILAYLGGHHRVQEWEKRMRIGHITTTGLPFVLMGLIAARPEIGVLTPTVLDEIAPLLPLGLGWIGFVIGTRFDARSFERVSPGSEAAVVLTTSIPVALIMGASVTLVGVFGRGLSEPGVFRDALLLGVAGAMAARNSVMFLGQKTREPHSSARIVRIVELEQLAGVFGLMFVSAFFRPQGSVVGWQLPSTAWLFMILGVGSALGLVVWAILTRIHSGPQFAAVLLGAVAFTAGMGSFLRLAAIPICFIAGAIIVNLGGAWVPQLRAALERIERPVYFLFLVIAGALWLPWEWRGWVLMAVFVLTRALAKRISASLVKRFWVRDLSGEEQRLLASAPMGALSVAIVVTAQDLYSSPTVPLIVTAVIGGTMLLETFLQIAVRRKPAEAAA